MALEELVFEVKETELTRDVSQWLLTAKKRIEAYWDSFREKPLPQYVECDFEYVAQALRSCADQKLVDGNLFCEWGCGFAVVTGVASILGFEAIGIEVEEFLVAEGRKLLQGAKIQAELWQGNFLPLGARALAEDADPLVSLTHDDEPVYEDYDMSLSDFAIVFAYPWPGEEHFLKSVFHRYARRQALLLLYRGPYQVELYRKK